ncbi:hypothetical protein BDV93DRAFT_362984 [Ceratobasidium sp. AG-I]|nr:hypothetical protein BDV93DRAFT_362984 [Ceratobasidium sp. AG-I]
MTNVSTPINSLHPEVLTYIFSLLVGKDTIIPIVDIFEVSSFNAFKERLTKKARLERATALSSVCQYWRSIILNTSSFWTYVHILLTSQDIQRGLDSAHVWLDRARTTPLDVFIRDGRYEKTPLSVTELGDFSLALPLGNKQVRTLELTLVAASHLNAILKNWLGNVVSNSLTHLYVNAHDPADEQPMSRDWLSQCHELQALSFNVGSLCCDHFPSMPKLVNLELCWSPVTLTTGQLVNILCACPSLQQLKLDQAGVRPIIGADLDPVPLHCLEVLSLQFLDATLVLPLISSTSDSLRLSIASHISGEESNLVNCIIHFSHNCTVTALQLNTVQIELRMMRELLHSLPRLQTLSLQNIYLDNTMMITLRGADGPGLSGATSPSTFPILRAIWLEECEIDDEAALRSLASVRPLQQLKLDNCSLPSGPIMESKALCEYLLDSVSDLDIIEYQGSQVVHFP